MCHSLTISRRQVVRRFPLALPPNRQGPTCSPLSKFPVTGRDLSLPLPCLAPTLAWPIRVPSFGSAGQRTGSLLMASSLASTTECKYFNIEPQIPSNVYSANALERPASILRTPMLVRRLMIMTKPGIFLSKASCKPGCLMNDFF